MSKKMRIRSSEKREVFIMQLHLSLISPSFGHKAKISPIIRARHKAEFILMWTIRRQKKKTKQCMVWKNEQQTWGPPRQHFLDFSREKCQHDACSWALSNSAGENSWVPVYVLHKAERNTEEPGHLPACQTTLLASSWEPPTTSARSKELTGAASAPDAMGCPTTAAILTWQQ